MTNNNIINVAYFVDDPLIKNNLLFYSDIRYKTLNYCYNLPGYAEMSRDHKLKIYDSARYEIGKNAARELALKYQQYSSENSLTYSEIAQYQALLQELARDFDLTDEFTENGIL